MSGVTRRELFFQGIKRRYFSSVWNIILSVLCLALFAWVISDFADWAIINAVWSAEAGAEACKEASGACWAIIDARWRLILFGLYPHEEHWRSGLACLIVVVMTVMSCLPRFWSGRNIALIWIGGFVAFYILMRGGILRLTPVSEE